LYYIINMALENTVVLLANHYQFSNRERIFQSCVKSRVLLWCKAGAGRIIVNGAPYEMCPGRVFLLPWAHTLTYYAAEKDPFLVGGIHLIPNHLRSKPVQFHVPHQLKDPLAESPLRKDVVMEGLEGMPQGTWTSETPLFRLAEYTVEAFRSALPKERHARLLGQILIQEMQRFFHREQRAAAVDTSSPELRQILQFIETHIHEPLSLGRLVRFSGSSASTLCRLFKRYYASSPVDTIINMKMEKARRLLLTGNLPVARVGEAVGMDDPYYFSKLFKKRIGRSPREYRRVMSLI
jgi:AraC-like DNA-binding protein